MRQSPVEVAAKYGAPYPCPPRVPWPVVLVALVSLGALAFWLVPEGYRGLALFMAVAAWPTWLCIWVRKVDPQASSLYWAIASLVTGVEFVFSWLLLIVVIFELREELLEHYNRREHLNLKLNFILTLLFSFIYFQYALNKVAKGKAKESAREPFAAEPEGSVPA